MKLENLQNDKEFMDKLAEANDVESIKALLAAKGIEMSDEEIKEALDRSDGGELSENDLENVAGGFSVLGGIAILAFLIGLARGLRCK